MTWITRGWVALTAVACWLAGSFVITAQGPYSKLSGFVSQAPPEASPGITGDKVMRYMRELGDDGRATYQLTQWLDFLMPLLIAMASLCTIAWAISRVHASARLQRLLLAPTMIMVAAEMAENALLLALLAAFPDGVSAANQVGWVTAVKMGSFVVTVLTMLVSALWVAVNSLRSGRRRSDEL